jgi:uncharacterized damage-inducible protein DinB
MCKYVDEYLLRDEVRAMTSSSSEPALIAEQLRRAFEGDAWHGPAVLELIEGLDAATAAAKPLPDVHSIWELVLHVSVWDGAALRRLDGEIFQPEGTANFPVVPNRPTEDAWKRTIADAKRTHDLVVKTVAALPESRLRERVPGKKYDFYFMLHGIAQHELYHAGQIAILKKVQGHAAK